jgi:hypothetical protein
MTTNKRSAGSKNFFEIPLESIDQAAVAALLRDRRQVVMECLEELLKKGASTAERNAAASALGTLTELGRKLDSQTR